MRLHHFILSFLLPVFLAGCATQGYQAVPESPSEQQLLRLSYVSEVDNKARQYFVFLPKGYADKPAKQWPLMLFLHGNGERGNGLDELDYVLSHGPLYEAWIQKKDLPFIIIAPQLHMFGMGKVDYIARRTRAQIPQRLAEGVPPRGNFIPVT